MTNEYRTLVIDELMNGYAIRISGTEIREFHVQRIDALVSLRNWINAEIVKEREVMGVGI